MSYFSDDSGSRLAHATVKHLADRGMPVVWDEEILKINPPNVPEWMAGVFEHTPVVLLVFTPEYVRRFAQGDDSPDHLGVLFEGRILLQRYYNHSQPHGCPLVPVAEPTFDRSTAPLTLQGLAISHVDPDTGAGYDELVSRVQRLWSTRSTGTTPADATDLRTVVSALEDAAARPGDPQAVRLVYDWLTFRDVPAFSWEFAAAEPVIKASGDLDLMCEAVDACLRQLDSGPLTDHDKRAKAEVLINGRAWYLRRTGQLMQAVDEVEKGIALAEQCRDDRTVNLGKRHLAHIYRRRAEIAKVDDRRSDLDKAERNAEQALAYFRTETGGLERAATMHALARILHARHRLLRDSGALRRAARLTREAAELPAARTRERIELLVLRCEISIDSGRLDEAGTLLDRAVELLDRLEDQGACCTRLRARAHEARARLFGCEPRNRGRKRAVREAKAAAAIYHRLALEVRAAECEWFLMRLDRAAHGLNFVEVHTLEKRCPDPRTRLTLAREFVEYVTDERPGAFVRWQALQRMIAGRVTS